MKNHTIHRPQFLLAFSQLNMLSMDVAMGALFSGFFARIIIPFDVHFVYWIILPLSVWVVYTADHLMDAYRLKGSSHTERHRIHYKYFKLLMIMVLIFAVTAILLTLMFLPLKIFYFGICVGLFSLFYFLLVQYAPQSIFLQKEWIVAFIFSLGIWGVPFVMNGFDFTKEMVVLFLGFFVLALADVLVLSFYELGSDTKDHHQTWTVKYGKKKTKQLIWVLLGFTNIICFYILISNSNELERIASIIYLLMATLIMGLVSFPEKLEKNFLYRYLVEVVFWLPGLILFLI